MLLAHGANPNKKDNLGITPLLEAVKAGADECINLLLAYGARLEVPNAGELMCNTVSAGSEQKPLLRRLLAAGALRAVCARLPSRLASYLHWSAEVKVCVLVVVRSEELV